MTGTALGCCIYTIRNSFARDPYGTAYALRDMGYTFVEFGNFTLSARQWRDILSKSGLGVHSVHIGFDYQEMWLDHVIEYVDSIGGGARAIVYPAFRREMAESLQALRAEAEAMNAVGRRLREHGYTLAFHNHAFEFGRVEGKTILDALIEYTDPGLVQFQFDAGWAARAGEDPLKVLRKLTGRCESLHLKDLDASGETVPVGEGTLGYRAIIGEAAAHGIRHLLVEQDDCRPDELFCARANIENVRKLLPRPLVE